MSYGYVSREIRRPRSPGSVQYSAVFPKNSVEIRLATVVGMLTLFENPLRPTSTKLVYSSESSDRSRFTRIARAHTSASIQSSGITFSRIIIIIFFFFHIWNIIICDISGARHRRSPDGGRVPFTWNIIVTIPSGDGLRALRTGASITIMCACSSYFILPARGDSFPNRRM